MALSGVKCDCVEAAVAAEQLRTAQEDLARQTAAAQVRLQELSGAAQAGMARAETAEALAAHRHVANQAAQQQIYELNSRMARFMADIVAGRDPTAKAAAHRAVHSGPPKTVTAVLGGWGGSRTPQDRDRRAGGGHKVAYPP